MFHRCNFLIHIFHNTELTAKPNKEVHNDLSGLIGNCRKNDKKRYDRITENPDKCRDANRKGIDNITKKDKCKNRDKNKCQLHEKK